MAKSKNDLEDILEDMHVELAKELAKRIKDGTATAADLGVARQFLRDNNIEGNPRKNKPLSALTDAVLPFPSPRAANE